MEILKVAVLRGGISSEREVSLKTGAGILAALHKLGHTVIDIDFKDDIQLLVATLKENKPDVAFNALHGIWGEDGCIQGLLELLGIPYTHSGVTASAIAMDKEATRQLCTTKGIDVALGFVCTQANLTNPLPKGLSFPVVVKPVAEGSSVGVTIVRTQEDFAKAAQTAHDNIPLLVEEYIPGREFTVPVLEQDFLPRPLPVIEIIPKAESTFYDYASKYQDDVHADFIVPAAIPAALTARIQEAALAVHTALGCRGVTRSDFRYDPKKNRLIFLEINTQPGMTSLSLVPASAKAAGLTYQEVVAHVLAARHLRPRTTVGEVH